MSPRPNCRDCGASIPGGAKFCRGCGAAVEETTADAVPRSEGAESPAADGACPACSTPVPPGAAFCRACGERQSASGGESAPTEPPPAVAPSRRSPPPPGPPSPPGDRSGSPWPLVTGIVVACVLLGGVAGGAAYLLTRDDGEPRTESFLDGDAGTTLADDEEAGEDDFRTDFEPDDPTSEDSDDVGSPPSGPSRFEKARDTWFEHWQAVDEGRYADAFGLFHPGYETDRGGWVASHEDEASDVNVDAIAVERGTTEPLDGEYWLYVKVPLRDSGGSYAGVCRLFYGEVRLVRSGSRFLYRPGEYRGRMGSFGRNDLGGGVKTLRDTDSRCP